MCTFRHSLAPFCSIAIAVALTTGGCATQAGHDGAAMAAAAESPAGPAAEPGTIAYDRAIWLSLIGNHEKIRRDMKELANGVEATTESDDPEIAAMIRNHAFAMQRRMHDGSRVRQWDPVFVKLFDHHEAVHLDVQATDKGVRILETSDDPEVVRVLHSHAAGVSEMVKRGGEAARNETPFK